MESTLETIKSYLMDKDLIGLKRFLTGMSKQEKETLRHYCLKQNLAYHEYCEALKGIESEEELIESLYKFSSPDQYSMRPMEVKIDILNELLYWEKYKNTNSVQEAKSLVSIQELWLRVDLINQVKRWRNSDNIGRCWNIVEELELNYNKVYPNQNLFESLVEITFNFIRGGEYRMRMLKPSPVLIRYIKDRDCLRLFKSKDERTLKKWQKKYNSAK